MNFEYFNEEKKERGFSPEIKIGNCEDIYSTIIFYATAKKNRGNVGRGAMRGDCRDF